MLQTSGSVAAHDKDHSLALASRELGQGLGQRRHTRPPILIWAVALHGAQTLAPNGIQFTSHSQELEV